MLKTLVLLLRYCILWCGAVVVVVEEEDEDDDDVNDDDDDDVRGIGGIATFG